MHKSIGLVLGVLYAAGLACSLTPATPTPDNSSAIDTAVAQTIAAEPAAPTETSAPEAPAATDTSAPPEPTAAPTDVYAPDPLTPGYTGLIFDFGTCYDFDAYQPASPAGAGTDACLDANGLLTPQNGALMNGYVTFEAPSKNECIADNGNLLPDPIAPNSDLYMCLRTDQGSYGFMVMREYQLELERFTFDMYIFP